MSKCSAGYPSGHFMVFSSCPASTLNSLRQTEFILSHQIAKFSLKGINGCPNHTTATIQPVTHRTLETPESFFDSPSLLDIQEQSNGC